MKFHINKQSLHDYCVSRDIHNLYHANTVGTAITFLNNKSILSRKFIEDNGFFQTVQSSDAKDKKFNIWDGIFLDFVDIHSELRKRNIYGPFLFSFSIDLLLSEQIKTVKITKKNPIYWKSHECENDWYYSDINEFIENYRQGNKKKDLGSMIILENMNGQLPIKPHCNKLIFDNPNLIVDYQNQKKYLRDLLGHKLYDIILNNELENIPREIRHKGNYFNCSCWWQYNFIQIGNHKKLKKLFHFDPNKIEQ